MDWEAFYNSFRKPGFISGYEIQNRLGGGAFGDVYKARKTSIGKPYAIKFLKVEDDAQREAVEHELDQVRHFAAIDHPNLVTIEDMGSAMGVPYLIMGYAGEDTLARRLKAGPLDPDEALLLFTQTCRGVLALHDRRLVHFDIKPSNVFIKGDVARVGDYGLSKLLVDGRMTLSFGRGTPQYMAPEILRSRADHRADIYSLGVLLFECLTGSLPYQPAGDGGLVLREEDVPPDFPDSYPAALREPTERCLRLSPDDRFDDVGQMIAAIGQTARQGDSVRLEGQPKATPQTSAPTPPSPPPPSTEQIPFGLDSPEEIPAESKGGEPISTRRELTQSASDLARGAVGVARGMLGGLKPGQSARFPLDEAETRPGSVRPEPDASGVDDGGSSDRARALVAGLSRGRTGAFGEPAIQGAEGASPVPVRGRTVPVPPRVEGGVAGAVGSGLVVSFEVLISLLGNLMRGAVAFVRMIAEKLSATSGGFIGKGLRLGSFLVIMSLVGFVLMALGLAFLGAVGGTS